MSPERHGCSANSEHLITCLSNCNTIFHGFWWPSFNSLYFSSLRHKLLFDVHFISNHETFIKLFYIFITLKTNHLQLYCKKP